LQPLHELRSTDAAILGVDAAQMLAGVAVAAIEEVLELLDFPSAFMQRETPPSTDIQ
jgi:hypothetical protein